MMRSVRLDRAAADYRHLLERGYNPESARRLVSDRYLLSKKESWYLLRCVMPKRLAMVRRKKLIPARKLKGKAVLVDGYNTLITLEARRLFRCDDGVFRDLSGVFGGYKISPTRTRKVLASFLKMLKKFGPIREVIFYFDKNVSKSGELSAIVRRTMAALGLNGNAVTVRSVDRELKMAGRSGAVIVTTDSAIIDKVKVGKIFQPSYGRA